MWRCPTHLHSTPYHTNVVCVTLSYLSPFNTIPHQRCLCDVVLFISIQHHTTPTFSLCDAVLVISIQRHTTPTLSVWRCPIHLHSTPYHTNVVCVTLSYLSPFNTIPHQRCLCDVVLFISIQHHTTPPLSRCEAVLLTVAFRDGRTVRLGEKVDEVHDVVYTVASRQQFAPVPWTGRVPIGGWQLLHAYLSVHTQHLSVLFITSMRTCTPWTQTGRHKLV